MHVCEVWGFNTAVIETIELKIIKGVFNAPGDR